MSKAFHLSCSNCPITECIFCNFLKEESLLNLEESKNTVRYTKGQFIYHEGTPPTGLYCIYQGKVKVVKQTPDGKEQIVYLLKTGEMLGAKDIFSTSTSGFTTSACAIEDSVVCHISKNVLFELINANPKLYSGINEHLCKILGLVEGNVLNFFQRNVKERVALNLLKLEEKFGTKVNDQVLIDIHLSREDMANMVGTATETLIRILSELRKEGMVDFNGKKIAITDIKSLRKIAAV